MQRRDQTARLVLLVVAFTVVAVGVGGSAALAHEGEDHGDAAKVPAASGVEDPVRRAERSLETPSGVFVLRLVQNPVDPRSGESAQFAVAVLERVEGGFGAVDGLMPVEGATVEAKIIGTAATPTSSVTFGTSDVPGTYEGIVVMPAAGDGSLELSIRTSDARTIVAGFPLQIALAPVNTAFWVGLAFLAALAAVAFFGFWYAARGRSQPSARPLGERLVPIVGAALTFGVGILALGLLVSPRERRELSELSGLAGLAAAKAETSLPSLRIPKESQLLFGIRTESVSSREIVAGLRLTGTVRARPQSQAVVASPVPGRLSLADAISVGSVVGRGQQVGAVENVLNASERAQLEAQAVELQARVLEQRALAANLRNSAEQARATLAQARRELQRATALVEAGVASRKRLEEARTAVDIAEQSVAAATTGARAADAQADVAAASIPRVSASRSFALTAPVAGVVTDVRAAAGQQVEAGAEVIRILDLSSVFVEARAFEGDLDAIRMMESAALTVPGTPDIVYRIGKGGEGRLVSIGSSVDPETRTLPVIFELQNPGNRLKDGIFVDVTIDTTAQRTVTAVPKAAVVRDQGETFVFVFAGGEYFERRPVKLGAEGQDYHEVTAGLAPGDRVVVEGIYQLRATRPAGS